VLLLGFCAGACRLGVLGREVRITALSDSKYVMRKLSPYSMSRHEPLVHHSLNSTANRANIPVAPDAKHKCFYPRIHCS